MFDLIILGGGPAGYNAAERAAKGGLKTLLIEKKALGGVCLNEGCVPTKTLLYSAKIFDYSKHGAEYGVKFEGASIDHAFVVERKDKIVKMLTGGIGTTLKKLGVTVINGDGVIKSKGADGITVSVNGEDYTAKDLIIATGSEALVPPIEGLRESVASGFALTNREILALKEVPARLAVIGGGVIGLEMASYFKSVGSKVTIVEMLDHIAGNTDRELSENLKKHYMKKGVEFILGAKVTSVKDGRLCYEKDGKNATLEADKVLCAIGRRANTKDIGLENIGVLTERGAVVTDEQCKTNVAGVWAAGDVNGKIMLAHTAYREGEVCINNILRNKDSIDYTSIPSVIYTNPEIASVGESKESAEAKGYEVDVWNTTLKLSGRYIAENEGGDGFVKIIVDKKHHTVLGVHMVGNYSSEIIYGAAIMVEKKMRVESLKKCVFPHPTVGEVIREAMFNY